MGWGRWIGGTVTSPTNGASMPAINLHYVGGSPVTMMPTTGVFNYVSVGGTRPTDSLGNLGDVTSAIIQANLASGSLNFEIGLTFSGVAYLAFGNSTFLANGVVATGTFATVNCTPACVSPAGGAFAGAFTGSNATGLGLVYHVNNGALDIVGAQAFMMGAAVPFVPSAAYIPNNLLIELSTPFISSISSNNFRVAPVDITYSGVSPTSFIQRELASSATSTYTLIGGAAPVTGTITSATTGIQFGRWSSVTALESSYTRALGDFNWQMSLPDVN